MANAVIAHEMMHFLFYSYMEEYPDLDKKTLWESAEIFNKLIQNTTRFRDFNYPEDKLLTDDQEQKLAQVRSELNPETVSVKEFVNHYLKYCQ